MKYLKIFEEFKVNNITEEDIINVIKNDGFVQCDTILNFDYELDNKYFKAININSDVITLEINGSEYITYLKYINRIEYDNHS